MATSINLGYCGYLAGSTWNDTIGRLDIAASTYLGGSVGGVLQSISNPLQVLASSGMNITVNPGSAVIPSNSGATQGAYRPTSPSLQTLTVATAPGSPNTRIDLICINVDDLGSSSSYAQLLYVEGTAGNPGVAPTAPNNSLVLAQIAVGSGVSSILQTNITDERFFAIAPGGVLVCPNMASLPAGATGQLGYDVVNSRLFALGPSGAGPLHVYSFPAAETISTTNLTATYGSETTFLSCTITSPGGVDLLIIAQAMDMWSANNPFAINQRIYIDSTLVQQGAYYSTTTKIDGTNYRCGNSVVLYQTSSAKGTTPAAGSHTIQFRGQPLYMSAGNTVTLGGASSYPIDLFVSQASL